MNDISIGAVGAAIIAGLISLLGLIIGKEQKVSEFRQAWIDELRKCLVSYLANINAIADTIRVAAAKGQQPSGLEQNYKSLNEANHGIRLRVNDEEQPSIDLLKSMEEFESIAGSNSQLTPKNIRAAEENFLTASKSLLKFEWRRVKRGERTYFWTRNIVIGLITIMLIIFAFLWYQRAPDERKDETKNAVGSSMKTTVFCSAAGTRVVDSPPGQASTKKLDIGRRRLATKRGVSATTLVCNPPAEKPSTEISEAEPTGGSSAEDDRGRLDGD